MSILPPSYSRFVLGFPQQPPRSLGFRLRHVWTHPVWIWTGVPFIPVGLVFYIGPNTNWPKLGPTRDVSNSIKSAINKQNRNLNPILIHDSPDDLRHIGLWEEGYCWSPVSPSSRPSPRSWPQRLNPKYDHHQGPRRKHPRRSKTTQSSRS